MDERLLAAIPNGGHRHIGVARKLKAEGTRAGIPDYTLYVSRGGYNALLIELKHEKGILSKSQKEMIDLLGKQGYLCFVAYGWDAARVAIQNYIQFGRTELP